MRSEAARARRAQERIRFCAAADEFLSSIAAVGHSVSRFCIHSCVWEIAMMNRAGSCAAGCALRGVATGVLGVVLAVCGAGRAAVAGEPVPGVTNPVLFVTQVPIPGDFTSIGSVFGNHRAAMSSVGRGGDLWIRYADGTLRNLTAAAGYGVNGQQGAGAIAVRDPCVHWDGQKAVFSMVVGGPTQQYDYTVFHWQLYEITGMGPSETPVITRIANQPAQFNNVSPVYGTDDAIIFTSDRPRNGAGHLYPQLDEYEEAATVSGLWRLTAAGGLELLNHAPSGDFTPFIDSFGRVLFTQWDHLQRDQQADTDAGRRRGSRCRMGLLIGRARRRIRRRSSTIGKRCIRSRGAVARICWKART